MSIDTSIMAEIHEAAERAYRGIRDRDEMRAACIEMDREREALRKRVGTLNISVDLIRELRDE